MKKRENKLTIRCERPGEGNCEGILLSDDGPSRRCCRRPHTVSQPGRNPETREAVPEGAA